MVNHSYLFLSGTYRKSEIVHIVTNLKLGIFFFSCLSIAGSPFISVNYCFLVKIILEDRCDISVLTTFSTWLSPVGEIFSKFG